MKPSNDSIKQLKWQYSTRVSRLYEVSDTSVFNVLIAKVEYYGDTFVTMIHNKTDLLSKENIEFECRGVTQLMERWLADEVDRKLTKAQGEI